MRVLLVDDEKELVSALSERLEMRGIQARWVTTGKAALEAAQAECFDLAVLDVKMPGMGGLELKERLAQSCPRLKFIFLTAYGSEQVFDSVANDIGDEFYLVKPININELMAKIKALSGEDKETP
jgi:DNA-binding response OmpR family regulator